MENSITTPPKKKLETYLAIVLIVLVTIITYGLLIKSFGFYLDDWYILWGGRAAGPGLIVDFHQFDRPLMGYFYAFYFQVLGSNPLGWQIFALFLKLAGVLVFWWILRMLWPKSLLETTSAALLFAVYPGFLQMPQAGIKVNPLFTLLSALISIAFTIKSVQVKAWWKIFLFQFLSFLFGTIYLFYIEYMVGLEFFRWAFLWIALQDTLHLRPLKERIKKWFVFTAPMWVALFGMVVWRLFFFESGRVSMNVGSISGGLLSNPLHSIIGLIVETSRDFIETQFSAWFVPAYEMSAGSPYQPWAISVGLALFVIVIYLVYTFFTRKFYDQENQKSNLQFSFIWIGFLGIFAALFPVVLVGRQVYLDLVFNGFNKYTLHASVGVSLLFVGLLSKGTRRFGFVAIITILLGFAVYTHYFNGLRYQSAWQDQRDLWWQLTWRAPDLEDGTLLTALLPPGNTFNESYEIWGPANIIYRPNTKNIPISGQILNSQTITWFQRGIEDVYVVRGLIEMPRDYNKTLILSIPDALSCLHAMDGNRLEDYREPLIAQAIFDKSHIDRIVTEASETIVPPNEIFGPEPDHQWCYYYQKISLAHQRGDWEEAVALGDEAEVKGFKPLNRSEWIPLFEAYANTGRLDDARHLATIIKDDKDLKYLYCSQIDFIRQNPSYDSALIQSLICE